MQVSLQVFNKRVGVAFNAKMDVKYVDKLDQQLNMT